MNKSENMFPAQKDIVSMTSFVRNSLANLHPVYFAMVMATGIISINFKLQGFDAAATILFVINLILYASLTALFIYRSIYFTSNVIKDCSDHQRAPGFFTVVAANSIIGTQCFMMTGSEYAAKTFFVIAVLLWLISIYSIFVLLTVKNDKPPFEQGINGGWLVSIVATQSIPVIGLIPLNPSINNDMILFVLTVFWLFGGMLYIWIISIIFYRYMFFKFDPNDLMPPYWINMGAMAISSLAGSLLILKASNSALLLPLLPFIKGLTLMYWATATWWIPMLFILGFWRHSIKKISIAYTPLYWGLVFPLGMYSVCTIRLVQILPEVTWLEWPSQIFTILGACAWSITFLGMLTRLIHIVLLKWNEEKIKNASFSSGYKNENVLTRIGTVLIVTGLVIYCLNLFTSPIPVLLILGIGFIVWLKGIIQYLNTVIHFYTGTRDESYHVD